MALLFPKIQIMKSIKTFIQEITYKNEWAKKKIDLCYSELNTTRDTMSIKTKIAPKEKIIALRDFSHVVS